MRPNIPSLALGIAGLIHLPASIGVLSADRLATLYGIEIAEPNLVFLMRHRAVLLGLLSLFLLYAAMRPHLQATAFVAGLVSVGSFLGLAMAMGGYNPQVSRVVWADVVAMVALIIGVLFHLRRG